MPAIGTIDREEDLPETWTAVEQFAFKKDMRQLPSGEAHYRELIPKTAPGPGEQYAFAVDLDKCSGCKACVAACHSENGLDEDESWRSVGLVQGGDEDNPAIQHVTSACHHCLEPACMHGCPTKAYVKDPDTGIVKHLDDQCFGCQYCILKCPYDVPKYNKKRGIVHKCDMCIGRLEVGQAPACVRACPTGAIRITVVDQKEVKANAQEYVKVPGAPSSDYTFPTTRYTTNRVFPSGMEAADHETLTPEHSHLPLVAMLVLTQLSVGAFAAQAVFKRFLGAEFFSTLERFHVPLALGIGLLALAASVLHLGRPHLAFRAILGFRRSWLSREIVVFGLFAGLAVIYALGHFFFLETAVLAVGVAGIFCSAMVYRDTKRPFWDNHFTTLKFFLTAVILGLGTMLLTSTGWAAVYSEPLITPVVRTVLQVIVLSSVLKVLVESGIFLSLAAGDSSFLKKTAMLMVHHLKEYTFWRFVCGLAGGVVIPLILLLFGRHFPTVEIIVWALLTFALTLTGELLERYLFFRAVVPLKMPGGKIC